jgi:farnesyl-diphosphate farnesyltransferase
MTDWDYCRETLPKVSRTFALNISVLKGKLHRSVLTAYLFCRIIDTVEDACKLAPGKKIKLLLDFQRLLQIPEYRASALAPWVEACGEVDGNPNDLDLLSRAPRVFNVFDSLPDTHRRQIVPAVARMAQGMAYFQKKFDREKPALLDNEQELEEYCYFVAGCVGEMLCGLFFAEIPRLSETAEMTMRRNAVSFGLGLQMTNIGKDFLVDRKRGWSYIPRSLIVSSGLTVDEFGSGKSVEKNLQVIRGLLRKTVGHLRDALRFILAIPNSQCRIRLFCVWPLWMAMETVAALLGSRDLVSSEDPVKISRATVKKILRRTPAICYSNFLLQRSFDKILKRCDCGEPPPFDLADLQERLNRIPLDTPQNLIRINPA